QYKRNRFYDPVTTTFTQEDPIGIAGGLNAYGFAGGDPVSYGDPQGNCGAVCVILVGAAAGAAINASYHGYELYSHGAKLTFANMWGAALTGALEGAQIAQAVVSIQSALSGAANAAVMTAQQTESSESTQSTLSSADFTNVSYNPAPEHDTFWLHNDAFK